MNRNNLQQQPPRHPKLWAVIPAAGSGSRFSSTELKQYQYIQDQTVLEHSIARLNHLPLAGYVLAIGQADDVAQNLNLAQKEKAFFCVIDKKTCFFCLLCQQKKLLIQKYFLQP